MAVTDIDDLKGPEVVAGIKNVIASEAKQSIAAKKVWIASSRNDGTAYPPCLNRASTFNPP